MFVDEAVSVKYDNYSGLINHINFSSKPRM